jgi:predicted nucleic acid-binding protein
LRTGQLDVETRADALMVFARFCAESGAILPVTALHFRIAARFSDQHAISLRAADALHFAICADHGTTLLTLDAGLVDAGMARGVSSVLL